MCLVQEVALTRICMNIHVNIYYIIWCLTYAAFCLSTGLSGIDIISVM